MPIDSKRLEENKLIKSHFLVVKEIPAQYKINKPFINPFGYIYCIENKLTHKKYIGSTYASWTGIKNPTIYSQLRKRVSDYIYEYNKTKNSIKDGQITIYSRPIIRALVSEGIENFIMYPIAETVSENHISMEKYFIKKYDTVTNGYNVEANPVNTVKYTMKHMNSANKKSRSDPIVCINLLEKKIIFSDSMKLFADFVGSTKDMIKNTNRKGRIYKGWYVFYLNISKRNEILNEFVLGNKLSEAEKHSNASKLLYKSLFNTISNMLKSNTPHEYFPDFTLLPSLEYNI